MNLAPIVLFVYRRPHHTRQTIAALQRNEFAAESDLIVYADGPKDEAAAAGAQEVREYVRTVGGFRSVTVVEREENLGLARSVIAGVTEVVNRSGRVIVLEDDMVTSPHFLRYMNEALELYRDEEQVASIHGYLYPIGKRFPAPFFLKGADCWGWGTWQRAWCRFESDGTKLLAELRERGLTERFDFDGTHPYTAMLEGQVEGSVDSWAIRWYASAFLREMVTLYPNVSMVNNIGLDCSGTNCDAEHYQETVSLADRPLRLEKIPVEENEEAFREFARYFSSLDAKRERAIRREARRQFAFGVRNRLEERLRELFGKER